MKKAITGNIEFKEEQRFRRSWFWILLLSPLLASIGILLAVGFNSLGKGNEGFIALGIAIPVNFIIFYCFFIARFEMIVTDEAVYYRWKPFNRKYRVITKAEIGQVRLRKSPLLQLGSKRVLGYGRIHNLGAAKGLQFVLKSGRKIFISSEKINGFQKAIEKLAPVSLK